MKETDPTVRQRVSIFGATGSVGQSALSLIEASPDGFQVVALTARSNALSLAAWAKRVNAEMAIVEDQSALPLLQDLLGGTSIQALAGVEAMREAAQKNVDLLVSAIVGIAGLAPTYGAMGFAKKIALANKESVVAGGELLLGHAHAHHTVLLPIDSEHNALFQLLVPDHKPWLDKIILTASGGPFRGWSRRDLSHVTPAQALAHPTWSMGPKISVDCATLVNKGLEVIEASLLFGIAASQIDVVVHPGSFMHALVSYQDGSLLAHLGHPDMRTAISYALAWPHRSSTQVPSLDLTKVGTLHFEALDEKNFPLVSVARQVLEAGLGARILFNTANEVGVELFLRGEIGFLGIVSFIEKALNIVSAPSSSVLNSLPAILEFDQEIREHLKAYGAL